MMTTPLKSKGEMDAFAASLEDDSLTHNDEGLRACAVCGAVRMFNAAPCSTCRLKDRKRMTILVMFVIFLSASSIGAAYVVTEMSPPLEIESSYERSQGLEDRLLQLEENEIIWGDAFTEEECRLCPSCCGEEEPPAPEVEETEEEVEEQEEE